MHVPGVPFFATVSVTLVSMPPPTALQEPDGSVPNAPPIFKKGHRSFILAAHFQPSGLELGYR